MNEMIRRIFKYEIEQTDIQIIPTMYGKVINIIKQNGRPMLYVMTDKESIKSNKEMWIEVAVVGTGHERDDLDDFEYINSLTFMEDALVFHYFVRYGEKR